jgi:hypothetical protein
MTAALVAGIFEQHGSMQTQMTQLTVVTLVKGTFVANSFGNISRQQRNFRDHKALSS